MPASRCRRPDAGISTPETVARERPAPLLKDPTPPPGPGVRACRRSAAGPGPPGCRHGDIRASSPIPGFLRTGRGVPELPAAQVTMSETDLAYKPLQGECGVSRTTPWAARRIVPGHRSPRPVLAAPGHRSTRAPQRHCRNASCRRTRGTQSGCRYPSSPSCAAGRPLRRRIADAASPPSGSRTTPPHGPARPSPAPVSLPLRFLRRPLLPRPVPGVRPPPLHASAAETDRPVRAFFTRPVVAPTLRRPGGTKSETDLGCIFF